MIQIRRAVAEDEALFNSWLAGDPVHKMNGITFADLMADNTEAWLISDEHGPLLFLRTWTAFRAAIQFQPGAEYRTAKAAWEVVEKMTEMADGHREIIIRPGGKAIPFSEKLGFVDFHGKHISVKD